MMGAGQLFTFLVLLAITIAVWQTSRSKGKFWSGLYKIIPPMILLYLVPSVIGSFHGIIGSGSLSVTLALDVLLPLTLILMTMSVNLKDLLSLSRPAVLIFLSGTAGIIVGGPVSLWTLGQWWPDLLQADGAGSPWRGLVCIAGSWINGTPGQASMKEIFGAGDELYFSMLAVDTVVQNLWLAFLFFGVRIAPRLDKILHSRLSSAEVVHNTLPTAAVKGNLWRDRARLAFIVAAAWLVVATLGAWITGFFAGLSIPDTSVWSFASRSSFWRVLLATTAGIVLSLTRARTLDNRGATTAGNFLFYFIFAAIGSRMDLLGLSVSWQIFAICAGWLVVHFLFLMVTARLMRMPFFFVAVGSQANIGGPATASMVAGAFQPHLASVGVLLGVLSNIIGNYCGLLAGIIFQWVAKG